MNLNDLKAIIKECCNDVLFRYKGKSSGITAEVHDSIPLFQVWYGNSTKEYTNVDDVLNDKFYDGKSIIELIGIVDFTLA